jgi:NAD-specific glutamate dehydrogenase
MRFGKVARGGIRWSDRPQDFRTEVLGLVKAQQVKNAVIVPVGAKGGFVPKLMPNGATRDVVQAEGVATYKLFISTLLDITDNIGPTARSFRRRAWCAMRAMTLPCGRSRQGYRDLRHCQCDFN